jgi:hypothetical protein
MKKLSAVAVVLSMLGMSIAPAIASAAVPLGAVNQYQVIINLSLTRGVTGHSCSAPIPTAAHLSISGLTVNGGATTVASQGPGFHATFANRDTLVMFRASRVNKPACLTGDTLNKTADVRLILISSLPVQGATPLLPQKLHN